MIGELEFLNELYKVNTSTSGIGGDDNVTNSLKKNDGNENEMVDTSRLSVLTSERGEE